MAGLNKINVYKVPVPNDALISSAFPRVSYKDAYKTTLPRQEGLNPVVILKTIMRSFPEYFLFALKVREKIARRFGLRTADKKQVEYQIRLFEGKPGQSIALFYVFESTPSELLTGLNDRHLNFRFSVICEDKLNTTDVVLATTVKFNNFFGRIYFFIVKPFHIFFMPVILKRAVAGLKV